MQLSNEMDRMMDSFFGRGRFPRPSELLGGGGPGSRFSQQTQLWSPQIDVKQRGNELEICADLPGIRKEDVNIEVSGDYIALSGERREGRSEDDQGFKRTERSYGSFCRAIPLPEGAQTENVRAQMRDGVLTVTVPVQEQQQNRRRIEIQS
jgi:HSP20 family protein